MNNSNEYNAADPEFINYNHVSVGSMAKEFVEVIEYVLGKYTYGKELCIAILQFLEDNNKGCTLLQVDAKSLPDPDSYDYDQIRLEPLAEEIAVVASDVIDTDLRLDSEKWNPEFYEAILRYLKNKNEGHVLLQFFGGVPDQHRAAEAAITTKTSQ